MKKIIGKILIVLIPVFFVSPSFARQYAVDATHLLKEGVLQSIIAKEMCSCRFVMGLKPHICFQRSDLGDFVPHLFSTKIDEKKKRVAVTIHPWSSARGGAIAVWRSEKLGCTLVKRSYDEIKK